jgi:hypothetical protein
VTLRADFDPRRQLALASIVYAAAIAFWFGPLLVHLGTAVLGSPGDGTSSIRVYDATSHAGQNILSFDRDLGIAAPQGETADAALSAVTPIQAEFVTLASHLVGGVVAWNVFILLAFAATAIGTFALLKDIGVSFLPALLGGYVFAFNPWQFEKAIVGHAMLVQTWIFPLLLWLLLRLRRRPGTRPAIAVGAVIAVAYYETAYLLLFAATVTAVFAIVAGLRKSNAPPIRLWLIAGGVGAALIAPFAVYAAVASGVSTVGRPIQDLQRFGAEPIEYVIPSPRHPVFGHLVENLFSASDPRHFGEPTLFFGLTTIALALVGAVVTIKGPTVEERRFLAVFGTVLVVVAFVMSLPRKVTIVSLSLPAPSWAIGHITTLWRVYARFAVVVGFGLVILAALGAEYIRRRTGHAWIVLAIGAVTAFELAVTVPIWRTTPPTYVTWLAKAPTGIVAEYPMFDYGPAGLTTVVAGSYFWQATHRQPLFNVYGESYRTPLGVRAVRAAAVDLSSPETPRILAAEGVRYVVVHDDVYKQDGLKVPALPPALKPIWRSGSVRIARVVATPGSVQAIVASRNLPIARTLGAVPGLASFTRDNNVPAPQPGWIMLTGPARISINDPNPTTEWLFEMHLQLRKPGSDGKLALLHGGRIVAIARYSTSDSVVTLGPFLLRYGIQQLELRPEPSPTAAHPLTVGFAPVVVPRLPAAAVREAGTTQPRH